MNQARIWLVVKPTVGLPLFLAAVAITALIVHASILTHTTWFGAYWQGHPKGTAMNTIDQSADKTALAAQAPAAAQVALAK
jgi:light-harvesting protein B-800-850 alpha chain